MSESDDFSRIVNKDEEGIPIIYKNCIDTYDLMLKHKSLGTDNGNPVYRGYLTTELEEYLGISKSQYGRVTRLLVEMGSIYQVKRGAASVPSEWALVERPTIDDYRSSSAALNRRNRISKDHLKQRVSDLSVLIGDLQARMDEMEEEIKALKMERIFDGTFDGE